MENFVGWAPVFGAVGLFIAGMFYLYIKRQPAGNELMIEISEMIHEGAMVFMKREYFILAFFIAAVFIALFLAINPLTAVAFLTGACCSMLAGYFGIQAATRANVRTTQAARTLPGKALTIAFRGGAAMGLTEARPSLSLSCSPSYGVLPAVRRLSHAECVLH